MFKKHKDMSDNSVDTVNDSKENGINDSTKPIKLNPLKGGNDSNIGRRSARLNKPGKSKCTDKRFSTKGKGRRAVFKSKPPTKVSPSLTALTISESVFFEDQYFQTGDIVSVIDDEDNKKYYAQCKCFITNQYCEKSVVLIWLLPTTTFNESENFTPSKFCLGPEEDFPRKMEYISFVCHAPSTYFMPLQMPYPVLEFKSESNFISTTLQ